MKTLIAALCVLPLASLAQFEGPAGNVPGLGYPFEPGLGYAPAPNHFYWHLPPRHAAGAAAGAIHLRSAGPMVPAPSRPTQEYIRSLDSIGGLMGRTR